jgi:ankyrin repeat protein
MKNNIKTNSFFSVLMLLLASMQIIAQNKTETPLINAVLYKGVDEVSTILAENVDINQQDEKGYTALIWACSYSSREAYRETAKLLISKGADVNIQATDGNAAIIEAAGSSPEVFKLLVENGADINLKKTDGSGAFFDCMATIINYGYEFSSEYQEVVSYLLTNGADVDDAPISGDLQGFTPLIFAARDNQLEIVRLLIDHGANVNAKNVYDQTPLSVAEEGNYSEMIALLKSHGAK